MLERVGDQQGGKLGAAEQKGLTLQPSKLGEYM